MKEKTNEPIPVIVVDNDESIQGTSTVEYYVNDFDAWEYIDRLVQLGIK